MIFTKKSQNASICSTSTAKSQGKILMIEISAEELLSYILEDVINSDGNLMNDIIHDV